MYLYYNLSQYYQIHSSATQRTNMKLCMYFQYTNNGSFQLTLLFNTWRNNNQHTHTQNSTPSLPAAPKDSKQTNNKKVQVLFNTLNVCILQSRYQNAGLERCKGCRTGNPRAVLEFQYKTSVTQMMMYDMSVGKAASFLTFLLNKIELVSNSQCKKNQDNQRPTGSL